MKKKMFSALVLALSIAGCAIPQPKVWIIDIKSPFSVEEVRWVKEPGTATVTGEAFSRDGTEVVTCAGIAVKLLPVTKFSEERMFHIYKSKTEGFLSVIDQRNPRKYFELRPNPPEYLDYILETICNSRGEFTFKNVPAGKYYLMTRVVWPLGGGNFAGGDKIQIIDVEENQVLEKIVSQ